MVVTMRKAVCHLGSVRPSQHIHRQHRVGSDHHVVVEPFIHFLSLLEGPITKSSMIYERGKREIGDVS
jgi:hypothetical protein